MPIPCIDPEAGGDELPGGKTSDVGPLENRREFDVYDNNGNPVTDIDRFQGDALVEEKSIQDFDPENQSAENWAKENVADKYYKYLTARDYLPAFYGNASMLIDFTGSQVNPELVSEIMDQVDFVRSLNLGMDLQVEFSGMEIATKPLMG